MRKEIALVLIGMSSWGLKAGIIEYDYSMEARLFAPYLTLDVETLVDGTVPNLQIQPSGISSDAIKAAGLKSDDETSFGNSFNNQLVSSNTGVNQDNNQDIALIKQMLGANTPLVKSQYLDFKSNFTEFVALAGQQGLNQGLVFDQALVSEPKEDFRWERARVDMQTEGGLAWPIRWIQSIYKYATSPTNLVVILLVLSVLVFIKRRFFA